jgi:hypothetical protein
MIMLPSIKDVIKIYKGDFDTNLDFAYIQLENSFWKWFETKDSMEFIMRFEQLKYLMQYQEIRKQFTDCKKKLINMHWMIIVYKLLK